MKITIPKGDNYILAVSSLSQSQKHLIEKLSSANSDKYNEYLDDFQRWIWDKGDVQCWASALNRFDDYITKYIIKENLGNEFLRKHLISPQESNVIDSNIIVDDEIIKKILKSTFLILENCTSKSLYASTVGLIALLDSFNPDIVCWSLRTLTTTCSNWKKPKRKVDCGAVYHLQFRLSTLCYIPIYRGLNIHTDRITKSTSIGENDGTSILSSFYKEEVWPLPDDNELIEIIVPPFVCNHTLGKQDEGLKCDDLECFDFHKSHVMLIKFKDLIMTKSMGDLDELLKRHSIPKCLKSIIGHYVRIFHSYNNVWERRRWIDVRYATTLCFPGFSTNNLVNICQVNTTLIPDSVDILDFCHSKIYGNDSQVILSDFNEQYRYITSMRSIVELLTLMLQDRIFPKVIVQALNFTHPNGLISKIIWDTLYSINQYNGKNLPTLISSSSKFMELTYPKNNSESSSTFHFSAILRLLDENIFIRTKYPLPKDSVSGDESKDVNRIRYDDTTISISYGIKENCNDSNNIEYKEKSSYIDFVTVNEEVSEISQYYKQLGIEFTSNLNKKSYFTPELSMAEFEEEMINFVMELIGIYILVTQLYSPPQSTISNSSSSTSSYLYIPHHLAVLVAFIDFISSVRHPYYIILILPICRALETLLEKKTYLSHLLQQDDPIHKLLLMRLQYEVGILHTDQSNKEDEGIILIRQWIIKTTMKFMELFIHPNSNNLISNSDNNPIISQSKIQEELLFSETSVYKSCLFLIIMYPEIYSLLNYSLVIQMIIPLVSSDPTIVPALISNNLIPAILKSINFSILQNDDILNILAVNLPVFFLHNDGIKLMESIFYRPLIYLTQFLTSTYAIHIDRMGEIATLIGNAFEEIVRYHPQLVSTISFIAVSTVLQIKVIQDDLPKWKSIEEDFTKDEEHDYYKPLEIPSIQNDELISDRMAIVGRFLCGYLSSHDTIQQFVIYGGPYYVLKCILDDSLPPAFASILVNHPFVSLFTFLGTSRSVPVADLQYQILPILELACEKLQEIGISNDSIIYISKISTCLSVINSMFRNVSSYNHNRILQSSFISNEMVHLPDFTSPKDYFPYGSSILELYNRIIKCTSFIFPKLLQHLYFNTSEKYLQEMLLINNTSISLLSSKLQSHTHPLLISQNGNTNMSNSRSLSTTNTTNTSGLTSVNGIYNSLTYPILSLWPQLTTNDFLWSTQIGFAYSNVAYSELPRFHPSTILLELCRMTCGNIRSSLILSSRLLNTFKRRNVANSLLRSESNNISEPTPLQYDAAIQIIAIFNAIFSAIPGLPQPIIEELGQNVTNSDINNLYNKDSLSCSVGQLCSYISDAIDLFYRMCIDDKHNHTFYILLIDLAYKSGTFNKIIQMFHLSMSIYWLILGKIINSRNNEDNKLADYDILPQISHNSPYKYNELYLKYLVNLIYPKLKDTYNMNGLLHLSIKNMQNNFLLLEHMSSWKRYLNSSLTNYLHKYKFHLPSRIENENTISISDESMNDGSKQMEVQTDGSNSIKVHKIYSEDSDNRSSINKNY